MNTSTIRSVTGVALLVAAVAACGSNDADQQQPPPSNAYGGAAQQAEAPTADIGDTLEIVSDGYATGVSDYTVANPRHDGDTYLVDLTLATKQGECVPGSFFALTELGSKVEDTDAITVPGVEPVDQSGALVAGEKRRGALIFPVPAGDDVTKIILYHGTVSPPKAFWEA